MSAGFSPFAATVRLITALAFATLAACSGGGADARRLPAAGEPLELGAIPGEPAELLFEAPSGGVLHARLRADGAGTLGYEVARVGTQDTERDGELLVAGERELPRGASAFHFDLPAAPGPLRLRLRWQPRDREARATVGLELAEEAARRPSILFVSLDTLSARHLSLHGYDRDTSPRLLELAREGVVFERAWSNAPWTTPSYASQFTGLLPTASQPREEAGEASADWFVAPSRWSLPEALQGLGLRTAAFVDNPNIRATLGFAQGFEVYDESATERENADPLGGFRHVAPLALGWLDGLDADEPFFLFVQAIDVHTPYVPPASVRGRYRDDGLRPPHVMPVGAEGGRIFGAIPRFAADLSMGGHPAELDAALMEAAYDEEIRALDAAVGEFLDDLRSRGVLDRTWLVISADHGESTGRHDSWFQHVLGHGDELHVPLIVRPPGGVAGRRVHARVQLLDLYPTLLDLVGADPSRDGFQGRSLRPALEGATLPPVPILSEVSLLGGGTVVVDEWKLVTSVLAPGVNGLVPFLSHPRTRASLAELDPTLAGRVIGTRALPLDSLDPARVAELSRHLPADLFAPHAALYDLRADADEEQDLAARHPARVVAMRDVLRGALESARSWRVILHTSDLEPDAVTQERLEKLGYADGH